MTIISWSSTLTFSSQSIFGIDELTKSQKEQIQSYFLFFREKAKKQIHFDHLLYKDPGKRFDLINITGNDQFFSRLPVFNRFHFPLNYFDEIIVKNM